MHSRFDEGLTRRSLLRLGLSGAALAAMPWPLRGSAFAAGAPHFLVTFFCDGGWDPTQTLDAHDPLDATDGIDVDVPGQPVSQIVTVGPITYMSNVVTRPAVDAFFSRWADRSAIVNGVNTRSTSHDQSRQLMLTGYLDPTRADFAVMAAHHNGTEMPLPHLLLSGPSFGGPFAGLSGRVGGQLRTVLNYDRIPGRMEGGDSQLAVSALGEAYVQQALARQQALESGGALRGRLAQFSDANDRGDRLVRLASSLPRGNNDGAQLAASLGAAFRAGMTTSVTISGQGGFDTHDDNTQQNGRWDSVFGFLDDFVAGLSTQAGVGSASLLDETTVIVVSEFGRTPELNGDNGKDHHPFTSALLVGKRVRPGVFGLTDRQQEGVKVNFSTGMPSDTGELLDVQNFVAGVLTLVGANPSEYLQSVSPFTAMVNA
jgi:uncharacterized protein (DUF1501 family)